MFIQVTKEKSYRVRREVNNCKQLLRFNNDNDDFLTSECLPLTDETRGGALSLRQQKEILLRYVGDPEYHTAVVEDYGVDCTTVCKTINFVTDRVIDKAGDWITFPRT